jgi:hypothetical protein
MVMRMRKASRFLGVFFLEALSSWSLDCKIFSTNQQESPGFRLEPLTGGAGMLGDRCAGLCQAGGTGLAGGLISRGWFGGVP